MPSPLMRSVGATFLAAGALGLGYAYLETKLFVVRRVVVPVLPGGEADIRVLHLSDLHLLPRQRRKLAFLRSLAELRPDVVVDTGDNIASPAALGPLLDALGPLVTATPGVFVWGSNDYWAPRFKNPARYLTRDDRSDEGAADGLVPLPWERLGAHFADGGWQELTNRRAVVELRDGRRLDFVGTDDAHLERDADPSDLPPAAASGPSPVLRIGVTHAPYLRALDGFRRDGVDLMLAGHTHGGQLCIPGIGALVTNCDLDRGRASGLHGWPGSRPDRPGGEGSTWLHVSAGAGTSPFAPVRFACRPSVTLLTLTAAA